MERRVFLAIILSFLVLYLYQALFVRPTTAPTSSRPGSTAASAPPAAGTATGDTTPAAPTAAAVPAVPDLAPAPQALVSEPSEREIIVDTATVQAVLTNRGGRLVHWRLKEYADNRGQPVDLVSGDLPAGEPLPFTLRVDDDQTTARVNNALYRVRGDAGSRVDATRLPGTLSFEYQDAAGVHVLKSFRFDPRNYIVSVSATVTAGDRVLNPTIAWGPGIGDV